MTSVTGAGAPPAELVRALVDGPGPVRGVEWHAELGSTNARAAELARAGAGEIQVVLADVQTQGRGRRGRRWQAPAGTSLLASWLLRPRVAASRHGLLSLLAGVVVAEVAERHLSVGAPDGGRGQVVLKWPNDVLVDGRKLAGVLAETADGCVVVGTGVNVDWRAVPQSEELPAATSLAELTARPVDRWRVLAGMAGVLGRRYTRWQDDPEHFLDAYRARCSTLGRPVRVQREGTDPLVGLATGVESDGRLAVRTERGERVLLAAGDVEHLRHASQRTT